MLTRRALTWSLWIAPLSVRCLSGERAWADYAPSRAPALPGSYRAPIGEHPFIFATPAKMQRFLDAKSGTCTKARAVLEQRVRSYLKDPARYVTPFSGCTLDTYLHQLTYEYGGAARVAADLATYAYLGSLKRGYGDAQLAEQARATAKQILTAWSVGGFHDGSTLRTELSQFCDDKGDVNQGVRFAIGLHIARGMPNWIHAQDMLLALGAFDADERRGLDGFLDGMCKLIRAAANARARESKLDCNRFSNHVSIQLAGLIAIARLRGNRNDFEDAAYGAHGGVVIPWTTQVTTTIYTTKGPPLNCYRNGTSPDFFQTAEVQPGEMMDRYRAHGAQTFGYPMFSLTHLMLAAEILRDSGYEPYGPIGGHPNPMQMALEYYGGYFIPFIAPESTKIPADSDYPGHEQYARKPLSGPSGVTIDGSDGLLLPFLLGISGLPGNATVQRLASKVRSFTPRYQPFSGVGAMYFGLLTLITAPF